MVYPPEEGVDLKARYPGKGGARSGLEEGRGRSSGFMALTEIVKPNEQVIVYAVGWVRAPEDMPATILLGSDDGVRVWINDALVHTNPAYRGDYPDQDRVPVRLKKGWNKVLVKILQGAGDGGSTSASPTPTASSSGRTEPPK